MLAIQETPNCSVVHDPSGVPQIHELLLLEIRGDVEEK